MENSIQEPGHQYLLANHIHACSANGDLVFLDLHADEYSCVLRSQAGAFHQLLSAERRFRIANDCGVTCAAQETIHNMVTARMLTEDQSKGRIFKPASIAHPIKSFVGQKKTQRITTTLSERWNFYIASSTALARLRFTSLESVVSAVRHRKRILNCDNQVENQDVCRALTEKFMRLRPFFPSTGLCLFNSFALTEFLARYRIYPSWVFGVRTHPWSAHCWVQDDDTVFNDALEHVQTFTPIMKI